MSHKLLPSLLLLSFLLLLNFPPTSSAPALSPHSPPHKNPNNALSPHLQSITEEDDDDLTAPSTLRRVFATPRVFNIIVRYRRFAPLALNADPETTSQIRAVLVVCLQQVRELQRDDNVRNVRILLSSLVLLLDWLVCLLN
eukprot:GFKZ01012382.1.p1 GENE.GFKZ01012382.1~~GFKZ01012382.1.p1  ORF type:complete len:141 (+),score=22.78 GFKZ01012382.1:208-630(+)